jgi:TPR repeat protein
LALGATYDPIALQKLGVRGVSADIAMARSWYEKAKEFGSAEGQARLEALASQHR